jgi:hypothetical protein
MDVFELGDPRYAAQVMPELFPKERQPVLANWSEEDREMFCGEYTNARRDGVLLDATFGRMTDHYIVETKARLTEMLGNLDNWKPTGLRFPEGEIRRAD